jgi:hypothetical protein
MPDDAVIPATKQDVKEAVEESEERIMSFCTTSKLSF